MRERFSDSVEQITGRKVIQFMSQVSFDPDMAAEIFILEPGTTETSRLRKDRIRTEGRSLRPCVDLRPGKTVV
jgi:uncharacterized protein YbcI